VKEFFESFKFKVILCIIALLFGMMIFAVTKNGNMVGIQRGFVFVVEPLAKLSNSISHSVSKKLDMLVNAEKYYNENQQLKEKLSDAYEMLIEYADAKKEISELRKFIGIKEQNAEYLLSPPCKVIGRTANDPFKSFIIDRGTTDGIKIGDPVVTGAGLVGVITEISESQASVRTLLSAQPLSVPAICSETGDIGFVQGSVTCAFDGTTKFTLTKLENSMSVGNIIKTSGESRYFPANTPIGIVEEIGIEDSGLLSYAIIRPIVSPNDVTSVMVIISMENDSDNN
jgi:rod shape-determining protein MreC